MDGNPHVTFVCVRNRVRSTFAEFYLEDVFRKRGEDATVSSAGFVPQVLKDQLAGALIPFPDPFFNTSMSRLTREFLLEKGIRVPEDWRSKELSPEMVDASGPHHYCAWPRRRKNSATFTKRPATRYFQSERCRRKKDIFFLKIFQRFLSIKTIGITRRKTRSTYPECSGNGRRPL